MQTYQPSSSSASAPQPLQTYQPSSVIAPAAAAITSAPTTTSYYSNNNNDNNYNNIASSGRSSGGGGNAAVAVAVPLPAVVTNSNCNYNSTPVVGAGGGGAGVTAVTTTVGSSMPPPDVCQVALLRNSDRVVAWTTFDPALAGRLSDQYRSMMKMGSPFLCCCLLNPFGCCLMPLLLQQTKLMEHAVKNEYWILTERDIKVVSMMGPQFGGNQAKSIPLIHITDCGVDTGGQHTLGRQVYNELPTIYVDTASSRNNGRGHGGHEAVGTGLLHQDSFVRQILDQRDHVVRSSGLAVVVVGGGGGGIAATTTTTTTLPPSSTTAYYTPTPPITTAMVTTMPATPAAPIMPRGSVADRMNQAKDLFDRGLISLTEYEQKRRDILAGV
jgi:hypothetical protein